MTARSRLALVATVTMTLVLALGAGRSTASVTSSIPPSVAGPVTASAAPGPRSGWVAVGVGEYAVCGVGVDESLWCWGGHWDGALGDGVGARDRPVPRRVAPGAHWRSVSLSGSTACGLHTDGTLWCWGKNWQGQAGVGQTNGDVLAPTQVDPGSTWQSVVSQDSHVCGLHTDGSAWCWGDNSWGALGDGTLRNSSVPVRVGGPPQWSSLGTDCGIAVDGTLWCWGRRGLRVPHQYGLAHDWVSARSVSASSVSVDGSPCAVNQAGERWCWEGAPTSVPHQQAGSGWVDAVGGLGLDCGLQAPSSTAPRTLWCWSSDPDRQAVTGDGTVLLRADPVQVGAGTAWSSISTGMTNGSGDSVGCAIDANHRLWCWSRDNVYGQLGTPGLERALVPVLVGSSAPPATTGGPVGGWAQVSTSGSSTCGVGLDHSLWCWGSDLDGALAQPGAWRRDVPVKVTTLSDDWVSVSVGGPVCALRLDHSLWCWGLDVEAYNRPTDPDGTTTDTPQHVEPGTTWSQVSAGEQGICAVRTDQTGWCWEDVGFAAGSDRDRQGNFVFGPKPVAGGYAWQSLDVQGHHGYDRGDRVCGIQADTTLWCWSGSMWRIDRTPIQVGTDTGWAAADGASGCARRLDGSLWCRLSRPTRVAGSSVWSSAAFATGGWCGLQDGVDPAHAELWCAGSNRDGQVGDGTHTTRPDPVRIGVDRSWESVSVAWNARCAIDSGHAAWCWGSDANGVLGNGAAGDTAVPTPVVVSD